MHGCKGKEEHQYYLKKQLIVISKNTCKRFYYIIDQVTYEEKSQLSIWTQKYVHYSRLYVISQVHYITASISI